ncbi:hypothetical protein CJ263_05605 [Maribacter cobaltidurans]|uniref:Uncharacterized protein n=1 Tax=Maribacter cobaltidurans TaxID=1178778 RepID=A0A223V2W0_9FLAO|nr:hypothetical protein CJ263_05605 [Maribacter cobaltidurans]
MQKATWLWRVALTRYAGQELLGAIRRLFAIAASWEKCPFFQCGARANFGLFRINIGNKQSYCVAFGGK